MKLETPEGASPDLCSQRSLPAGSGVGEHFVDAVRPFHRLSLGILPQALLLKFNLQKHISDAAEITQPKGSDVGAPAEWISSSSGG